MGQQRRRWSLGTRGTVALLLGAAVLARAPSALAGKKADKKTETKEAPPPGSTELDKALASDEDTALAALAKIADTNDASAIPSLVALLERGSTPKVLEEAMKTAAKLKAEALSPAIAPYVRHRTDTIRRAAVRALLKTKGPPAIDALRKALKSGDAVVRGTAATGLGALGAKESLPDLFRAFDHGVAEAGAAIGQLCTPEQCEQFAERTGQIAFDVMVTGFDQILFRPPSDIPDEEKIRLIGRMRELGTAEVGKYLADVGDRWPKDWSKKVKQSLDSAAHAIGGGVKQ